LFLKTGERFNAGVLKRDGARVAVKFADNDVLVTMTPP
jgi:hypothetical protein